MLRSTFLLITLVKLATMSEPQPPPPPPFTWRDCGSPTRSVIFNQLDYGPLPVQVNLNQPLSGSFSVHLKKAFDKDTVFRLDISRQLRPYFNFRIPCVMNFGSCDIEICHFFERPDNFFCPFLKKAGASCGCPVQAGHYMPQNVTFHLDGFNVPYYVAKISSGKYKVRVRILKKREEIGCLELTTGIQFHVQKSPKVHEML